MPHYVKGRESSPEIPASHYYQRADLQAFHEFQREKVSSHKPSIIRWDRYSFSFIPQQRAISDVAFGIDKG